VTTETYVARIVLPAAFSLLPAPMTSPEAAAELIAIGRQESDGWKARRQYQGGPARSFWQGELGGGICTGVLRHEKTREHAKRICHLLCIEPTPAAVYAAIEHQDILAAALARLLLATDPRPLPLADKPVDGWLLYLATWRPGAAERPALRPGLERKWQDNFRAGWALGWPGQVRT